MPSTGHNGTLLGPTPAYCLKDCLFQSINSLASLGRYKQNTILMGFRGNNFLETGAVYAPYIPLVQTPLVYDPINFTPRRGVLTRYAKKVVRPEFYGKIYVSDLEQI